MLLPVLDVTKHVASAHSIPLPCPCYQGSTSATTPPQDFLHRLWGSAGGAVPCDALFHHVAGVMLNSGTNQRTLECSADGRCRTGKINPQISSLMDLAAGRCFHVQQHLPRQIISLLTLYTAVQALDKQLHTAAIL